MSLSLKPAALPCPSPPRPPKKKYTKWKLEDNNTGGFKNSEILISNKGVIKDCDFPKIAFRLESLQSSIIRHTKTKKSLPTHLFYGHY